MPLALDDFVKTFARATGTADSRRPTAINQRTKVPFQPGIGPHSEDDTVSLVMQELVAENPDSFAPHALREPYPDVKRRRCDLCLGTRPHWDWAIEVKLLRFLGDNGKSNDNILMHLLSPYPAHRSALTDCEKLAITAIPGRKAILVIGYDSAEWPLRPAVEAFEILASRRVALSERCEAVFSDLIHPVHRSGSVFAWELC